MSNLELDNAIIQASEQLGYVMIRPDQNRAIKSFMEGRDVFISLPTGTGKYTNILSRSLNPLKPLCSGADLGILKGGGASIMKSDNEVRNGRVHQKWVGAGG